MAQMPQVHPEVIAWAYAALQPAPHDYSFFDGLRTEKQQRANIERGVSKSENSYHVPLTPGGYADAADLVPWVDGANSWYWDHVLSNAQAIIRAALELGLDGTWGGIWDRSFSALRDEGALEDRPSLRAAMHEYAYRRRAVGEVAFHDGCHFQRRVRSR
jgi:peptidoglycan L-alanyl-D-glutamate endopeptidase CwlK